MVKYQKVELGDGRLPGAVILGTNGAYRMYMQNSQTKFVPGKTVYDTEPSSEAVRIAGELLGSQELAKETASKDAVRPVAPPITPDPTPQLPAVPQPTPPLPAAPKSMPQLPTVPRSTPPLPAAPKSQLLAVPRSTPPLPVAPQPTPPLPATPPPPAAPKPTPPLAVAARQAAARVSERNAQVLQEESRALQEEAQRARKEAAEEKARFEELKRSNRAKLQRVQEEARIRSETEAKKRQDAAKAARDRIRKTEIDAAVGAKGAEARRNERVAALQREAAIQEEAKRKAQEVVTARKAYEREYNMEALGANMYESKPPLVIEDLHEECIDPYDPGVSAEADRAIKTAASACAADETSRECADATTQAYVEGNKTKVVPECINVLIRKQRRDDEERYAEIVRARDGAVEEDQKTRAAAEAEQIAMAKARADAEAKAKAARQAEAEAKARSEAEAKADAERRAEAAAKAKAEAEAKDKAASAERKAAEAELAESPAPSTSAAAAKAKAAAEKENTVGRPGDSLLLNDYVPDEDEQVYDPYDPKECEIQIADCQREREGEETIPECMRRKLQWYDENCDENGCPCFDENDVNCKPCTISDYKSLKNELKRLKFSEGYYDTDGSAVGEEAYEEFQP